ncbi:glycosyltransferase family 4 protein [Paenibacillus barengoltzii]|uniref:glycosyltransferase family 4 protein n=1 Tax=Paenibacillus barengoltzii TaxID=343517 RepID=UPI00210053C6|nr:glycosyltransferase family 4 protein [Paenibacillus barengoltzii]MEC2343362.1 glycosyltransferase family 4 protein [Paenibacillus barengoltzii]
MSDRKKLLLFSHVCNSRNVTGAEKLLLFSARKLSAYYDCTIVVPRQGSLSVLAHRYGIRTLLCDNPLIYAMCSPNSSLSGEIHTIAWSDSVQRTIGLLQEERPDAVLVNTSVNVAPAIAAKQLGIPVIWQITEVIASNEFTAEAVNLIDRYSDLIVGISESALLPFAGTQAMHKTVLLYPSWNPEDIHPELWPAQRWQRRAQWKIKPSEFLVGYISSYLIPEKGANHFIEAALNLAHRFPEAKFVMIGAEVQPEYYRSLKRAVQGSPHGQRFIFVSMEYHVESAFSAMDIVVVPGILPEGFGLTALEAMIFGKPVVAYASGGLREILESTGNGAYLVPTGDSLGLVEKCAELLSSSELSRSVGERNRVQAEVMFGPAAYELRLQELVQRMQGLSGVAVPLPEPVPTTTSPDAAEYRGSGSAAGAASPSSRRRRVKLKRAKLRKRKSGAGRSFTARRGGKRRASKITRRKAGGTRKMNRIRRKPSRRTRNPRRQRVRKRQKFTRR